MKKHVAAVFILMLAGLTGLVNAQVVHPRVVAQIPFEYVANGKTMPAGEYTIMAQGDGTPILWIRSGNENLMALPHATQSLNASEKTVLVFHRYGDRYFLASISRRGEKLGYEFPTNKLEKELRARNVTKSDVILLASLQ